MSGFSPNPDPIHVNGLSTKAGCEERLQSEVLRLHHVLEANNIELAQLRSALAECEELTKELADVLLGYHRQCLTASRGKMCERLTAEMADVLLNYHRQCLSASRGRIPRFRITVEPFFGAQDTHGSTTRAPTQAGLESNPTSPFLYHLNPSQRSRSSEKANLGGEPDGTAGKGQLSHSATAFRFNRGFVEPCRESGWDIRWGQAAGGDSEGEGGVTPMSKADTDSTNAKMEHEEEVNTFTMPGAGVDFVEDFGRQAGRTPVEHKTDGAVLRSGGGDKNGTPIQGDPLDEDGFLAILTKLNVKSSLSKNSDGENRGVSQGEGFFRFGAKAPSIDGAQCAADLQSTPKTKKRPKPADTLGLADRFSSKSLLKGPISTTSSVLGCGTPGNRTLGEPPRDPALKGMQHFKVHRGPSDAAKFLEDRSQTFKSWIDERSPIVPRFEKYEPSTPKTNTQGEANRSDCDISDILKNRTSALKMLGSPKQGTRCDDENPFSEQGNAGPMGTHSSKTPVASKVPPASNPPLESITPRNCGLFGDFRMQESFTAKLERFEKLIGGKPMPDKDPAFGSNFSGSPRSTNKTRKSIHSKIDELVDSARSSQDENKVPERQGSLLEARTLNHGDSLFLLSERHPPAGTGRKEDNNASNGCCSGGGLKFEGVQRSSPLAANLPLGENTILNISKHAGNVTTPTTMKSTPNGGRLAYDNVLMVIKNQGYQLKKVTPVSKRVVRSKRATFKPSANSTVRRCLRARRQAVGHSEDDSD